MKTLTEIRNEEFKREAKQLCRDFLSQGRSVGDLMDYASFVTAEGEYQIENNTIGGLSNGRVV